MESGGPKNKWIEPQTIVGIIGLLAIGYGSYLSFQSDMSGRIGGLEVRVAVMESQMMYLRGDKR